MPALAPGQQCMMTVLFAPANGQTDFTSAIDLAYSDSSGTVPDLVRDLKGAISMPFSYSPTETYRSPSSSAASFWSSTRTALQAAPTKPMPSSVR